MLKKTHSLPILFSGIQPTGTLHIGHYIGAIRHWAALQDSHRCFFAIVDLHAITTYQAPEQLKKQCYDLLSLYIACGIDPKKNVLFLQSHVSAHSQLAWILNCFTQVGALNRMTQFKDKSKKQPQNINVGLYTYPVLMAADILLYGTHTVPVGSDQKQHLELARDIALRFNHHYGDTFVLPEPHIPSHGERLMGLQNPQQKMSKSDANPANYIALLDPPDQIRKKIKRAVTDSNTQIVYDNARPGLANLLTLYSIITSDSIDEITQRYAGKGYGVLKEDIAESLVKFLEPIQTTYQAIRSDTPHLNTLLQQGAEQARAQANIMLNRAHEVIGLIPQ